MRIKVYDTTFSRANAAITLFVWLADIENNNDGTYNVSFTDSLIRSKKDPDVVCIYHRNVEIEFPIDTFSRIEVE